MQPIPEKIFQAFIRGDHDAFSYIYETCHTDLHFIAHKFVDQTDEADDIPSYVFGKLWEYHDRFKTEKNVRAFLFTAVKNRCLNFLKRGLMIEEKIPEIQEIIESQASLPEEPDWSQRKLLQSLHQAIDEFPKQCRAVCQLAFVEDWENEAIAKHLGISEKTVRNQKYEGVKRLRIHLGSITGSSDD